MTRYVVTGATGRLGSRILRSLVQDQAVARENLVISSSNPNRGARVGGRYGIEARYGDYRDATSLRQAFSGADVLFLTSHPDGGIQRVQFHINAIEAARAAGISTVVYSSMMLGGETGMDSVIGIQQGHIHTMRYLAQSGIDHVIVRQGIYAEGWTYYAGHQRRSTSGAPGELPALEWLIPHDIAVAWTALDDLAQGNAAILANYRQYHGQTLRLTGPVASKISEIAGLVEERTGRAVTLRVIGQKSPDHWYDALARGEGAVVDPLLGQLLGHRPRAIHDMGDELFDLPW